MKKITLNGCTYTLIKGDRAQGWFYEYCRADDKTTLDHVYKSYSDAKQRAYGACYTRMTQTNSTDIRILSATCNFFTLGYMRTAHDYLLIETYANRYAIDLNEKGNKK